MSIFAGLLSPPLLALGVYFLKKTNTRLKTFHQTRGTVSGYETHDSQSTDSDGSRYDTKVYSPVITFTDHNRQPARFVSQVSSTRKPYQIGTQVEILYNPENTREAEIKSFFALWFPVLFCFSAGVFFLLMLLTSIKNLIFGGPVTIL